MRKLVPTAYPESLPFLLQALTVLPCGCVAADYRAELLDLELVSIEAKGPHCPLDDHLAEGVLGLGERGELEP